MKLGVFTVLLADRPLEGALGRIVELGLDAVEIGTGNYPGNAHCRPDELLADDVALGVGRINLFSGCPGDSDRAEYPNWVTCAWPTECGDLLEWQWSERVSPHWREQAALAGRWQILTALRLAGNDDVLSREHEGALLSIDEGFRKGVAFLRPVMAVEPPASEAWWT